MKNDGDVIRAMPADTKVSTGAQIAYDTGQNAVVLFTKSHADKCVT